jgi:hypothetical protein
VGLLNLCLGEVGIALEQERPDGLLPGKVDELLVRLDRVGASQYGGGEQKESERKGVAEEMGQVRAARWHEVRITVSRRRELISLSGTGGMQGAFE